MPSQKASATNMSPLDADPRERLAARYARRWKRTVRAEDRRRRRLEQLEAREAEFAPGLSKRIVMLMVVGVAAAILVALLIYLRS